MASRSTPCTFASASPQYWQLSTSARTSLSTPLYQSRSSQLLLHHLGSLHRSGAPSGRSTLQFWKTRLAFERLRNAISDDQLLVLLVSHKSSLSTSAESLASFLVAPSVRNPTWAADLKWAIVMFGAVILLAMGYYFGCGRHSYVPPVRLVKND